MTSRSTEISAPFRESVIEAAGVRARTFQAGSGDPVIVLDTLSMGLTRLHRGLAESFRVTVLELPLTGGSGPSQDPRTIHDLAAITAQAAASLESSKFTFVGSSLAANVALCQVLAAPEQVEALVLVSPTIIKPTALALSGSGEDLGSLLLAHPEDPARLAPIDQAAMARELEALRQLHTPGLESEVESRLGEIQCPTLAVFGLNDRLAGTEAASIYRAGIPNCHTSIVYDAGHAIVLERPEALIDVVSDYVERQETFIVGKGAGVINP